MTAQAFILFTVICEFWYAGTVNIDIELKEDRKYFVIHAKYLTISKTELTDKAGGSVELKALFEVPKNEWWVIQPAKGSIPKSTYVLKMDFVGLLTRNIVGFYRSTYTGNGKPR